MILEQFQYESAGVFRHEPYKCTGCIKKKVIGFHIQKDQAFSY
jgi:hypothetical protein